jgi:formate dehydrogenase subunit gamma
MDRKRMPDASVWNAERAEEIIAEHIGLEGPMLPIPHALQEEFGHISTAAVPLVAEPKCMGS